jgi:hypothetical protein
MTQSGVDATDGIVAAGYRRASNADARIGAELKKLGKATGTRGQLRGATPGKGQRGKPGSRSGGSIVVPPDLAPSAFELGLTKKRAAHGEWLPWLKANAEVLGV